MPAELQPYNDNLRTVRGVEIFRAGEWNGEDYSTADLDEMVAAFGSQGYAVPLKIGHGEAEGMPAYGWVDRIYRQGDTLKADFKDIPVWVFDMVFQQHSYDHVSIEIYFGLKRDGKTYKRALKAVALLGAETPAVSGLAPLREAIFAPAADTYERQVALTLKVATPMPEPVIKTTPVTTPTPTGDNAALIAQLAAANEQITALSKTTNDQKEATTQLLATVAALTSAQQDGVVDVKIAACSVPSIREHLRHIYSVALRHSGVVKFSADGKTEEKALGLVVDDLVAQVNKFAASLVKPGIPRPQGLPGGQSVGNGDVSQELDTEVKAHMAAKGIKPTMAAYQDATKAVLISKPDLAERYSQFARGQAN